MDACDEIELLKQLQKGDTKAYLALYQRYHVLVYHWALKLVKIPQLAEDLVQDVFLKVWQIRERLNPQQSFPAFIYRIARNKAFNLLKKISSDDDLRSRVMTELSATAESAENKLVWQQYEQLLKSAIDQLPQQRQKVFKLCRQDGKTYDEAAAELGISRNTVKEHMVMAVKNIKEYFYKYGDIAFLFILLFSCH
ncbi:RNA polymerase sigma factor [Ferruginibacter sp.]|nr:RNA polymerase sigma-70 factor [Ferruginibacter sp.]